MAGRWSSRSAEGDGLVMSVHALFDSYGPSGFNLRILKYSLFTILQACICGFVIALDEDDKELDEM